MSEQLIEHGPFAVMAGAPWNVLDSRGARIALCGGDCNADYERFGPAIAAAIVKALNSQRQAEQPKIDFFEKEYSQASEALTAAGIVTDREVGSAKGGAPLTLTERIAILRSKLAALEDVKGWTQATLTALNVGDIASDSPLHLKLREVMIRYRQQWEYVE